MFIKSQKNFYLLSLIFNSVMTFLLIINLIHFTVVNNTTSQFGAAAASAFWLFYFIIGGSFFFIPLLLVDGYFHFFKERGQLSQKQILLLIGFIGYAVMWFMIGITIIIGMSSGSRAALYTGYSLFVIVSGYNLTINLLEVIKRK